jgi:hypothetical protein
LFAHCAGLSVNALHEKSCGPGKRRHAGQLAQTLNLDMQAQGFQSGAPIISAGSKRGKFLKPSRLAHF